MNPKQISKLLSLVLRHQPEVLGIQLDPHGWAKLDEIILQMQKKGMNVDQAMIEEVVASNDKQRFRLDLDQRRIRANQGHSIDIDLALEAVAPPPVLYHGTATRFIESIQEKGLIKGNRQHVHLSPDQTTAHMVGRRHGKPVILTIKAGEMQEAGFRFYLSVNGVWLTDHIPVAYILF